MEKYIMALDQGTTGSRCILFTKEGRIAAMSKKEFTQIYPHPSWVEHDPMEIWSSQMSVITEAITKIGVSIDDIEAIGITNQRETTIMWDKNTGRPVYNAIVWQCRRSADRIRQINKDGMKNVIHKKTGLIPDAYFSATKIEWILDNVKGVREAADKGDILFGTVDSWLIWNLTRHKAHLTDYTNASRTMLFNIDDLEWDKELLDYFDIPRSILPGVRPSSGFFAETDESVLGRSIPIFGVAGDQQSALYGQCCFEEGEAKNTYGTGCFVLMNTAGRRVESEYGLITTLTAGCRPGKPEYALEGSVFMGGATVKWLKEEMGLINEPAETEDIAFSVDGNNGVYMVPAFVGLGAPYWDQFAKGTVTGLTRGSNKAHFVRAALESIAYQSHDVIRAMESDANVSIKKLKIDGGAGENNFLMQFQADLLSTKVIRPSCVESTALGAAFLAGIASGFWRSEADAAELISVDSVFEPTMGHEEYEKLMAGWIDAVKRTLSR